MSLVRAGRGRRGQSCTCDRTPRPYVKHGNRGLRASHAVRAELTRSYKGQGCRTLSSRVAVAFGRLDEWCLLGPRAVAGRSLVAVGGFTGQVLFTHFKPGVYTCTDDHHLGWVGSRGAAKQLSWYRLRRDDSHRLSLSLQRQKRGGRGRSCPSLPTYVRYTPKYREHSSFNWCVCGEGFMNFVHHEPHVLRL